MKLQGFTIVFALIAIPLILVLTYYIQLQVDTITLQNSYDSKLLDATYDAMSSFEINTANEDLSSVSDSLRTIIEASNNTFFNTLATNLGMSNASKSYLEPYVPAVLYTLYDGYYISTPTLIPKVLEYEDENSDGNAKGKGGQGICVGDSGVEVGGTKVVDGKTILLYTYTPNGTNTIGYNDLKEEHSTDYGQLLFLSKDSTDTNKTYTTDVNYAKKTRKNVLKTYMPYSARYKRSGKFDITVVYTLDNYVTINGTINTNGNDVYYTKSGYLIPVSCVTGNKKLEFTTDNNIDITTYNQNSIEEYIKSGEVVTVKIGDIEITSGNDITPPITKIQAIDDAQGGNVELNTYKQLEDYLTVLNNKLEEKQDQENITAEDRDIINKIQDRIRIVQYELDQMSATTYYAKAYIFSKWVYDNLNANTEDAINGCYQLKENDLVKISNDESYIQVNSNEQVFHDFNTDIAVFNTEGTTLENDGITEICVDSPFYTHKLNVIRNSIQYNLNLAMSTYNLETSDSFAYEMPVLQNKEWERVLSNVSIVSFMQGYACGLKTYNNYMVVSSTNNELIVDPKNIYYVPKSKFSDEESEYHRIDCSHIKKDDEEYADEYISFTSKEVKYDKIYDKSKKYHKYKYDHKNLACYFCINDGNYKNKKFDTLDTRLKKAYYIAVGKERNNIYKMNAVTQSLGYEVIYDKVNGINRTSSSKALSEIKSIEIVLDKINTRTSENLRYNYYIGNNGTDITTNTLIQQEDVDKNSIPSSNAQTEIKITIDPTVFSSNSNKFSVTMLHVKNELQETSTVHTKGHPNRDDLPDSRYNGSLEIYNDNIFQKAIKYIRVIYK